MISDLLGILGFLLAVSLAIIQYREKRKALIPIFGIKSKEIFYDHFRFVIHNKNSVPINIKRVEYPPKFERSQKQEWSEEFGVIILHDVREMDSIPIEVYYQNRDGKNKKAVVEIVSEGRDIHIGNQVHKNE